MHKNFINWSSGKDAMMALLKTEEEFGAVSRLVTTYNSALGRVSMHGIPIELLEEQARALQISLQKIALPGQTPMEKYNQIMKKQYQKLMNEGFTHSVFGDIFLADLKKFREEQCKALGLKPYFPLWKNDTDQLALDFIEKGYKAIIVCVDAQKLEASFCGRFLDKGFLEDLPKSVDACGENGEFHTFVFDGPRFSQAVDFRKGDQVVRGFPAGKGENQNWNSKFFYQELIPY